MIKAEAPKKTTTAKGDDIDGKLVECKQEDNKIVTTKKEKDQISTKAGKENKIEQVKNKKNLKNLFQERPADFDDGWLCYIYSWKLMRFWSVYIVEKKFHSVADIYYIFYLSVLSTATRILLYVPRYIEIY